jgi:hypothetical protein
MAPAQENATYLDRARGECGEHDHHRPLTTNELEHF